MTRETWQAYPEIAQFEETRDSRASSLGPDLAKTGSSGPLAITSALPPKPDIGGRMSAKPSTAVVNGCASLCPLLTLNGHYQSVSVDTHSPHP